MRTLHIDLETYSDVDLRSRGLDVYSSDPSCCVLMLAYAFDDEKPKLWLPHVDKQMPSELRAALTDSAVLKFAWNAQFESVIIERVLGVKIPEEQMRCVMVNAYMLALPGSLEECGKVLRLGDDFQKSAEGKRLIRLFCVKHAPTKKFPQERYDWTTHPEEWKQFCNYCMQDVVAERKIHQILSRFPIPEGEWKIYALDQRINKRGIYIDLPFVRNAITFMERRKREIASELHRLTGLVNPNSTAQLLPWARQRGYPFDSLGKERIAKALADFAQNMRPECLQALRLRLTAAKTSVLKFRKIVALVGTDGRLRFTLQMAGAGRTLRWAGRGVQVQNLPRCKKEHEPFLAAVREMVLAGDYEILNVIFGDPIDVLTSSVRTALSAAPGKALVIADLNAIETRLSGWISGCESLAKVFESGRCPYKTMAAQMFGVPYDEVTPAQRQIAKPVVLGCFGAYTEVLTSRGWVPIISVRHDDLVYDGIEWVTHGGVVDQGVKSVIELAGVEVTSDHQVLCGEDEWKPASFVQTVPQFLDKALATAVGLLAGSSYAKDFATMNVPARAAERSGCTVPTSRTENHLNAKSAPACRERTPKLLFTTHIQKLIAGFWTRSPIDTTPSSPDADSVAISVTQNAASPVDSPVSTSSSSTVCLSPARKTSPTKSTESITTATTLLETSVSLLAELITGIKNNIALSPFKGKRCLRWFSTSVLLHAIETLAPSAGKSTKDTPEKRSSQIKSGAAVRTYDILNCGPRRRFVVRTNRGPLIVHNCWFMLSGGAEVGEYPDTIRTGLWAYAEAMGVKLTREEAHAHVAAFREAYPEAPEMWAALERAAMEAITTRRPQKVGPVEFDVMPPFLRMRLPSGRYIYYLRPKVGEHLIKHPGGEFVKRGVSYEGKNKLGQWTRVNTHGGKFVENICQAVARDILCAGLLEADRLGFNIVTHVHDEIVGEEPIEDAREIISDLEKCMSIVPDWAPGLLLAAEGFDTKFYTKG